MIPGGASNTLVVSLRAAARNVYAEEAAAERALRQREAAGRGAKGRRKQLLPASRQAGHNPEDITEEKIRCRNARFSRMCARDIRSMVSAHE